jgi:hypothetical protein
VPVDCRVVAASKSDLKRSATKAASAPTCTTASAWPLSNCRRCASGAKTSALLFEHFCSAGGQPLRPRSAGAGPAQQAELMAHDWPGNLRELSNVATRFVLGLAGGRLTPGSARPSRCGALNEQLEQFERALIADTLRRHGGDVAASAKAMGRCPSRRCTTRCGGCSCRAPTSGPAKAETRPLGHRLDFHTTRRPAVWKTVAQPLPHRTARRQALVRQGKNLCHLFLLQVARTVQTLLLKRPHRALAVGASQEERT